MKTQLQIYITTNLVNGKQYIGLHSKNDDLYFGSGVLLKINKGNLHGVIEGRRKTCEGWRIK
jgi:hypothetical protein